MLARTEARSGSAIQTDAPALAVSKRFGRFKDEGEHAVRAPDVKRNEALENAWKKFAKEAKKNTDSAYFNSENYRLALSLLEGISYSAQDVEKFSIACIQFQDENQFCSNAGLFLSALINNCKDDDFVINTRHLTETIWYLGYQNTKNIIVSGDIGAYLGFDMKYGTITVEGDAGGYVGQLMEGGSIFVKGSAGNSVGASMKNGRITVGGDVSHQLGWAMEGGTIEVNGNASVNVGGYMKGGEIHIYGTLVSLDSEVRSGKIYHKGKLVFPKEGGH